MYQKVTNAIRKIGTVFSFPLSFKLKIHTMNIITDNEHIVFFESAVSDIYPCGFSEGPGGPDYDDRQAYSYHIYCTPTNDVCF